MIMGIDANAALEENRFGEIVARQGLIDLAAMQHGNDAHETFMKGTKTIDCILGTKGAAEAVRRSGCLAHNDGIVSDHRACFVDFDKAKLCDDDNPQCDPPQDRALNAKNKKASIGFKKQVTKAIAQANIVKRAQTLDEATKDNVTLDQKGPLEKLDEEIDTILKSAEAKIPTNSAPWWAPTLHKAHSVWKHQKAKPSFTANNTEDDQEKA